MLFLFIDDIDLSTTRCMDVVRTLLSYLSNSRIVTFISGDMKTFEEALTLEFLRQEQALNEAVFDHTYFSVVDNQSSGTLLERKSAMAYEYLKKIIPPAYRTSIKYWSLEERGNYSIEEEEAPEKKRLVDLLVEVSKEKVGDSYFIYREDGEQKNMGLAFYMFDDTPRGLNNVYNTLQELYSLGMKNEKLNVTEDEKTISFWRLIETIVDVKSLYARHKEQLFQQIFVFDQRQIKTNFENAYQFLFKDDMEDKKKNFSSKECFAFFLLIDFADRLFSQQSRMNDDYTKLKSKIIEIYLGDETIDGKIVSKNRSISINNEMFCDNIGTASMKIVLRNLLQHGDFIFLLHFIRYFGRDEIYCILNSENRIQHSERKAAYNIAYALMKALCAINNTEEERKNYLAKLYIQMPDAMLELLNWLSTDSRFIYGRGLTDDVDVQVDSKKYMDKMVDLGKASNHNLSKLLELSQKRSSRTQKKWSYWEKYERQKHFYWCYFENELREKRKEGNISFNIRSMAVSAVRSGITKTIMNQMQMAMNDFHIKSLMEVGYNIPTEEKKRRKMQALLQIDEHGLWNRTYVKEKVFPFLEQKRKSYILDMSAGRVILDATEFLEGAFLEFKNCDKGSSGKAHANRLEKKLHNMMFFVNDNSTTENRRFSDGKYYLRLEQMLVIQCLLEEFLIFHPNVQYGKKEIRKLLMEIRELPLVLHTPDWNRIHMELEEREKRFCIEKGYNTKIREADSNLEMNWNSIEPNNLKDDYIFIFHCYLRYLQENISDTEKAGVQAKDIALLVKYMLDGETIADEQVLNEVYEVVGKDLDLTEEEFEALF